MSHLTDIHTHMCTHTYTLKVGSRYGRKLLRYSVSSGFYMKNAKNISNINLCQMKSDASNAVSATQG